MNIENSLREDNNKLRKELKEVISLLEGVMSGDNLAVNKAVEYLNNKASEQMKAQDDYEHGQNIYK